MQGLLCKPEDLSSGCRAHAEKPGMVVHACNASTGEAEMGRSLGIYWPVSLAYSVSLKSLREFVSKEKVESN